MMFKCLKNLVFAMVAMFGFSAVLAAENVATIGTTVYATLAEAVAAAGDGVIITLADGKHTMPALENKNITFTGGREAVIDMSQAVNARGSTLTFDGVTLEFVRDQYRGFQHAALIVFNKCALSGRQTLYAPVVVFTDCELTHKSTTSVWTYGANDVTFTGCTFQSGGRAVQVYNEVTEGNFVADVKFVNCKFYSDGTDGNKTEALVETNRNGGDTAASNKYKLTFTNCSTELTNDDDRAFWGNKGNMDGDHLTVVIDGKTVYPAPVVSEVIPEDSTGAVTVKLTSGAVTFADGASVAGATLTMEKTSSANEYEINLTKGEAEIATGFAATVTMSAVPNAEKVRVYYLVNNDKVFLPGTYDVKEGCVTFSTNHFSTWGTEAVTEGSAYNLGLAYVSWKDPTNKTDLQIWGEVISSSETIKTFVVNFYDKNGTKVASTTLKRAVGQTVSWHLRITGAADADWWAYNWVDGAPSPDKAPAYAEFIINETNAGKIELTYWHEVNLFEVKWEDYFVATIDDQYYFTLQSAIDTGANEITLLSNVRELGTEVETNSGEFFIQILDKDITLDLNGKTVNGSFYLNSDSTVKFQNGTITNLAGNKSSGIESVGGNIELTEMTIANSARHAVRVKGGTAVINSGNYTANGNSTYHVVNVSHASTVRIAGGVFSGNKGYSTSGNALMIQDAASKVNVSGGTFKNAAGVEGCVSAAAGLSISGGTFDTWTYDKYLSTSTEKRYVAVKNAGEMYEVVEFMNWAQVADTSWYNETDTEFTLTTAAQLAGFAKLVNGGNTFSKKTVKLGVDIDLQNVNWTPIGYMGKSFVGVFDGKGKTISNFTAVYGFENVPANQGIGFFGKTSSPAEIKNVTIENATVKGSLYVGAIVGSGYTGKGVVNCHVKGDIKIDAWWYAGVIGGTGYTSPVANCTVVGNEDSYIRGNDGSYIAGIWGQRGEGGMQINNCSVTGLKIFGVDRIGGITGIAQYGNTIFGCTVADTTISASDPDCKSVGLIAGANNGTEAEPSMVVNNTIGEGASANIDGTAVTTTTGQRYDNSAIQATVVGTGVTFDETTGKVTGGTFEVAPPEKVVADGLAVFEGADGIFGVAQKPDLSRAYISWLETNLRIWGEVSGLNGVSSFVVNFHTADGEKIASTALKKAIPDATSISWHLRIAGSSDDEWWSYEWADGNPSPDKAPVKAEFVIDGRNWGDIDISYKHEVNPCREYWADYFVASMNGVYYFSLQDAIVAATEEDNTVTLLNAATIDSVIKITKSMTLNLNGKTLTSSTDAGNRPIQIKTAGVSLTIDGTVGGSTVLAPNGLVQIDADNVTLTVNKGYYFGGSQYTAGGANTPSCTKAIFKQNTGASGKITLSEVTVETGSYVFDSATGASNVELTVSGGTYTSNKGSKNDYLFGTLSGGTLNLTDVTIKSQLAGGIYAQDGVVTLKDCDFTVSGANAASAVNAANGAKVTIEDGSYASTAYGVQILNSGAAVAIGGGSVEISGTKGALGIGSEAGVTSTATITGGTFTGGIVATSTKGTNNITITGGTFDVASWTSGMNPYVADGYLTMDEGGLRTIVPVAAKIGETYYLTLAEAIAAAGDGATITLFAGTHTMPNSVANKNITITGTKDAEVEMLTAVNATGSTINFNGVTVKFDNDNYEGLQHAVKVTYTDCTHIGTQFLYAPTVEFTRCTFEMYNEKTEYAVWTYGAKDVKFNNCVFNTYGKAILVYTEGAHEADIALSNCEFNSNGKNVGKAAVELGQSANAGAAANYRLNFDNCTADARFVANNSTSNLWGNKDSMSNNNGSSVIIKKEDGTSSENLMPAAEAEVDGKQYASLEKAISTAKAGDKVKLLADVEYTGTESAHVTINKNLTLDLNGHTITSTTAGEAVLRICAPDATTSINVVIDATNGGGITTTANRLPVYSGNVELAKTDLTINGGNYESGWFSAVYQNNGCCIITGGSYKSADNERVLDNFDSTPELTGSFAIRGGKFYKFNPACLCINKDDHHDHDSLAEDKATDYVDGWYTVVDGKSRLVAKVESKYDANDRCYNSLQAAIDAANPADGDTIVLVADVEFGTTGTEDGSPMAAKSVTIDGQNLYNFIATGKGVGPILVTEGTLTLQNLAIVDNSVSYNEGAWEFGYLEFGGKLVMNNVVAQDPLMFEGSEASFTKCTFTGTNDPYDQYGLWIANGQATVTECKFIGARGLKSHSAYGTKVESLAIEKSEFNVTDKPGVALGNVEGATVAITGNTFTNVKPGDQNQFTFECDTPLENFNFTRGDNTINFAEDGSNAPVEGTVKSGTYEYDPTAYLNADYKASKNDDGTWTVVEKVYVAQIGETKYETLQDAFNAGGEVKLLAAVALAEGLVVAADKTVVLDLNGFTVSYTSTEAKASEAITNNGTLTIKDSSGEKTGTLTYESTAPSTSHEYSTSTIVNRGTLTVESGTIENTTASGASYAIDNNSSAGNAVVTVNGGTICAVPTAIRQFANGNVNNVTVAGGTVTGTSGGVFVQHVSNGDTDLTISGGTVEASNPSYGTILVNPWASKGGTLDVVISDDANVVADNGNAVNLYYEGADLAVDADVSITGGTITGAITETFATTDTTNITGDGIAISGGTFTSKPNDDFLADGYEITDNGNDTFGVAERKEPVCATVTVGETVSETMTLSAALEKAKAASSTAKVVVTLNKDATIELPKWTSFMFQNFLCAEFTLDGNGATITGLPVALFGDANTASVIEIKNLTIANSNIRAESTSQASDPVGAAFIRTVNYCKSVTLTNCHVVDSTISGGYVGGLVGYTNGSAQYPNSLTIDGCSVKNTTLTSDEESTGAVIGHSYDGTVIKNTVTSGNSLSIAANRDDKIGTVIGSIAGSSAASIEVFEEAKSTVTIAGVAKDNDNAIGRNYGDLAITGGEYFADPCVYAEDGAYAVDGAILSETIGEDDKFIVAKAQIGEDYYTTIQAAIDATADDATDAATITVLGNVTEAMVMVNVGKNVVIDFGGKTLNGSMFVEKGATADVKNGKIYQTASVSGIEVQGVATLTDMDITSEGRHAIRVDGLETDGTKLTVNSGTYTTTASPSAGSYYAVNAGEKSVVEIKGGKFVGNGGGQGAFIVKSNDTLVTIEDGEFYNGDAIIMQTCDSTVITGGTYGGNGGVRPAAGYRLAYDEANKVYEVVQAVAKIGNVYYDSLADAIAAAEGETVITLFAGTHTMPGSVANKNITIKGDANAKRDDVEVEMLDKVDATGATIAFEHLTAKFDNDGYEGLQHCTSKITYTDCIHIGTEFLYAPEVIFTNCEFKVEGDNYAVWTYGADKVDFINCTFSTDGKAILVYTEAAHIAEINVTGCTFNATTNRGKAAVEIGASWKGDVVDATISKYTLSIAESTADGNFVANKTDSNLWGNKNSITTESGSSVTITINGVKSENLMPKPAVAELTDKNGNVTKYESFNEAYKVASRNGGKQTIKLLGDASYDGDGYSWNGTVDLTIDLNGNDLTLKEDMSVPGSFYGGNTLTFDDTSAEKDGQVIFEGNAKIEFANNEYPDSVIINGGTFVKENENSAIIGESSFAGKNNVTFNGGNFEQVAGDVFDMDKGDNVTKGANVEVEAPEGYEWNENGKLVELPPVATVNGVEYTSLAKALEVAKAKTGDVVVKLIADLNLSDWVTVDLGATTSKSYDSLVLDGNGKTVTGLAKPLFGNMSYSPLTVRNIVFKDSAVTEATAAGFTIAGIIVPATGNGGSITLDGITVEGGTVTSPGYAAALVGYKANGCAVTIRNCKITGVSITGGSSSGVLFGHTMVGFTVTDTIVGGNTINNTDSSVKSGVLIGTLNGADGVIDVTEESESVTQYNDAVVDAKLIGRLYANVTYNGGEYFTDPTTSYATKTDAGSVTIEDTVNEEDGKYFVVPAVAKVGDVTYGSIQEAIDAAAAGQTVTLLKDVEESGIEVASDDVIVIDLNGKTVTGDILSAGNLTVQNGAIVSDTFVSAIESKGASAKLTLIETEGELLSLTSQRHAVRIEGGTATIDGGTYTATGRKGQGETVHAVNAGGEFTTTVTITGGTFNGIKFNGNAETPDSGAAVNAQNNAIVTIEGGTFQGGQNHTLQISGTGKIVLKGGAYDQEPANEMLVEGYDVIENDDGMFVVVEVPKGEVSRGMYSTSNNRIQGAVMNANPKESVVLDLYSGETKIATTTLVKEEYFANAATELTWSFCITGESSSWKTDWEEWNPDSTLKPSKVVLFIDGVKVAENTVSLHKDNFDQIGEEAVWADLPGVCTWVAQFGDAKYETVTKAIEVAKDTSAEEGEKKVVTVLEADIDWEDEFTYDDDVEIRLANGLDESTASAPSGYAWVGGVLMKFTNWIQVADTSWYNAGTTEFTLDTPEKLAGVAKLVNEGRDTFAGKTITLAGDMNLAGLVWPGIGIYKGNSFQGTFDGADFKVSNMNLSDDSNGVAASEANNYRGFFNQIDNATVKRVTVAGDLWATAPASTEYGGALIAGHANNSTIESCVAEGSVNGTHNVAGVVVRVEDSTIVNCTNKAAVTGSYSKMGGIAALVQNSETSVLFDGCVNEGSITSTARGEDGVGGIVGWVGYPNTADITIKNCENKGTITATGAATVGQIAAESWNGNHVFTGNKGLATTVATGHAAMDGLNYATVEDGIATYVKNAELAAGNTYLVTAPNPKPVITLAAGQSITFDLTLATIEETGITAATELKSETEGNRVTYTAKAYVVTITWPNETTTDEVADGGTFTLAAKELDGMTFIGWSGAYASTAAEAQITVTGDIAITANYLPSELYTEVKDTIEENYKNDNELVNVNDIVNLSLQYPTIQVGKDENGNQVADVGIKLMKATTLKDEDGKPNWTPVKVGEPISANWAADGETILIRLPADKKAQFFRFVPVNGLTPPPPVVSTPDDLKTEFANPETTKVEVSGGDYKESVEVPAGKEVVVKDGTFTTSDAAGITLKDNSTITLENGTYEASQQIVGVSANNKVVINGGEYNSTVLVWGAADVDVLVTGGTFNLWSLVVSDSNDNFKVRVTGGNFTLGGGGFDAGQAHDIVITGGTFNKDPSKYVPATHKVTEADGVWTVTAG